MNDCTQKEVCEQKFLIQEEKLKTANHRIEDLVNKTEEINNIANTLSKLELLTTLQRDDSIKRDKAIDDMNKTQIQITNTLQTLSENLSKTDEGLNKLDKKVDDISNNSNINIITFIKKIIYVAIGSGITLSLTKLFSN
ncbi:MAG: hypothetical protein PHR29_04860 [Acholeplasmataceae bacterium]|nr:hypothetical protein [Acholeplasmataceae bacterium]